MIQLNPPLPVACRQSGRKGMAHVLIDYGVEFNLLFVVAWDDTREIWCVDNTRLLIQENITFGRLPCTTTRQA
jgi:hypothetical protein